MVPDGNFVPALLSARAGYEACVLGPAILRRIQTLRAACPFTRRGCRLHQTEGCRAGGGSGCGF